MTKAKVLVDDVLIFLEGAYFAQIKVFEVPKSKKLPDGIKIRCVLVDGITRRPVLLLDNHAPFGFHLHARLPEDKNFRIALVLKTYPEAIAYFIRESKRVLSNEKK